MSQISTLFAFDKYFENERFKAHLQIPSKPQQKNFKNIINFRIKYHQDGFL